MQDHVRECKGWDSEVCGDRKVCVTNIRKGEANKVHRLEQGRTVQILQGVIVLVQFAVHAESAMEAAVSSRPQATHPPSDHLQDYAAHPHHTNHVCRLCCSRALWTEQQRAQLDSASEARCSAAQSMAPVRVLPPQTKPDKERPTRPQKKKKNEPTSHACLNRTLGTRKFAKKIQKVVGSEISASEVRGLEFKALKHLSKVRGHHFRPIFFWDQTPRWSTDGDNKRLKICHNEGAKKAPKLDPPVGTIFDFKRVHFLTPF